VFSGAHLWFPWKRKSNLAGIYYHIVFARPIFLQSRLTVYYTSSSRLIPFFKHVRICTVAYDDMVQHPDGHRLADVFEFIGNCDVLAAWTCVTAPMVRYEDHRSCTLPDLLAECRFFTPGRSQQKTSFLRFLNRGGSGSKPPCYLKTRGLDKGSIMSLFPSSSATFNCAAFGALMPLTLQISVRDASAFLSARRRPLIVRSPYPWRSCRFRLSRV
jgi:hypothetical protein